MRANSLGYLIKQSFHSVWANKLMSFASIGVLTACLVLIGGCYLLSENINHIVGSVEDQNEIVAFLDDFSAEESDAKTQTIHDSILSIENVQSATYISKAQALEDQKIKFGDDAEWLNGLEEDNPYPAYYIIKIKSLEDLSSSVTQVKHVEGVYQVNSADSVAEVLISVKNAVQIIGTSIFSILVLVALVIISNTVRLTVFSRRKEINIMKYVGATNRFIRLPFIIEGLLLGVLSAVLAFGLIWIGYGYLQQFLHFDNNFSLESFTGFLSFKELALPLFAVFFISGAATGVFGSALSMRKHLKV